MASITALLDNLHHKFKFRNVMITGFGLWVGIGIVSLILVTLMMLVTNRMPYSSLVSWSFSVSHDGSFTHRFMGNNTHFANLELGVKNVSFHGQEGRVNDTQLGNLTHGTGNFVIGNNTHVANFDLDVKNVSLHGINATQLGNFSDTFGNEVMGNKTHDANFGLDVKNVSLHGINATQSGNSSDTFENEVMRNKTHDANFGLDVKNVTLHGINITQSGNLTHEDVNNEVINKTHDANLGLDVKTVSFMSRECDIFDGKWVRDYSMPHYPPGSCPLMDTDFNCHLNGRPDTGFYTWKWQPNGCNIPRLDATDFLERLRGKKLVFVGDSLNRNMWESLVCLLRHSIKDKKRVYEISGQREFKKEGCYSFRFEDYNCSVDFVRAPFLVRESTFKGKNGPFATLRLDLMDHATEMYRDAHILVFNTGHWWTHEKTSLGEDYYQEGNYVHPRLKVLEAYKRAITTWSRWIDRHIDRNKTFVLFRGFSGVHFSGGQWNSGGQCDKETDPIFNEKYLENYPSKMRALEHIIGKMKTPVMYLNITRLTDYRKDAHPSIYRKSDLTAKELAEQSQDCSHWCLPGVPDVWNELLYVSLLKAGWGSPNPGK